MGPHPFPTIVRDFQSVISREIREQILEKEGCLPDMVIACVGGGSNAIGTFYDFIDDKDVRLIGCEAAGRGVDTMETAATVATGKLGIFHGMKSYFCQDEVRTDSARLLPSPQGWITRASDRNTPISTIPGGPNTCRSPTKRPWTHSSISPGWRGAIPAIESAHAVAYAPGSSRRGMGKDQIRRHQRCPARGRQGLRRHSQIQRGGYT